MQKNNPRFKRKRHRDNRSTSEVLAPLLSTRLLGVLDGSAVWLAPEPEAARLLDRCVLGLTDGGPATATYVRATVCEAFPGLAAEAHQLKEQQPAALELNAAAVAAAAGGMAAQPQPSPAAGLLQQRQGHPPQLDPQGQHVEQQVQGQGKGQEQRPQHQRCQHQRQQQGPPGRGWVAASVCVKLALEEAFFLAHALPPGVLRVCEHVAAAPGDGGGGGGGSGVGCWQPLAPATAAAAAAGDAADVDAIAAAAAAGELWSRCCALRPGFASSYAAYYHFRSKGYHPRSGVQYGSDYCLYQRHPAAAHADYCVLVAPPGGGRRLQWMEVQIANRLCAQVGKRLILLHVQLGPDTSSPACLDSATVEEVLVTRWVPQSQQDSPL